MVLTDLTFVASFSLPLLLPGFQFVDTSVSSLMTDSASCSSCPSLLSSSSQGSVPFSSMKKASKISDEFFVCGYCNLKIRGLSPSIFSIINCLRSIVVLSVEGRKVLVSDSGEKVNALGTGRNFVIETLEAGSFISFTLVVGGKVRIEVTAVVVGSRVRDSEGSRIGFSGICSV